MSAIIAVIGNSGAGKTTLANSIAAKFGFRSAREEHQTRPFQALMAGNLQQYACLNQVDYLLLRAEQEMELRSSAEVGIIDGGLEEDFFLFTKLFHHRKYLNDAEYLLCGRLYNQLRGSLAPVDLFIWMDTPIEECIQRYRSRGRSLEIAKTHDLEYLDKLMQDWIAVNRPEPLLHLDGSLPLDALLDQAETALRLAGILT